MRVRILGSAAGGGFPQWNCNCANCSGLRNGTLRGRARTQCSIAISADNARTVSGDGARWMLLNASPDVRIQISSFPELLAKDRARGSAIGAVMLTDAELDHITGLLSLREALPTGLYCTRRVFDWVFDSNPIFAALIEAERFRWTEIANGAPASFPGISLEAIFVNGKVPAWVKPPPERFEGATVACKISDTARGSSLVYVPAIGKIDQRFLATVSRCDCLLFDGSFWTDNEMELRGVGTRTASAMGHVPIAGAEGSLARLSHLAARKVYTHINNTNPILDEDSDERRIAQAAGWEIAEDAMDFIV